MVDISTPVGNERWLDAGRPLVPAFVVDDVAEPILHVSQLAARLGLAIPPRLEASRLAWDAAELLGAWVTLLERLGFDALLAPTPSRGRSIRNLTVNVFHPFELLPAAYARGWFGWEPERDHEREDMLGDAEAVHSYARVRSGDWHAWLSTEADGLEAADPVVDSPRGSVRFSDLIASQRWHAAFHYRQLCVSLAGRGLAVSAEPVLEHLVDLELPADVF